MEHARGLAALADDEVLRRLLDLLRQSRRVEADLVAHIGEVDARRLYAREAAPSMFAYCIQALHLSEAEAYLRITVARATREHTMLLEMLRDGRLHLSAIAKLLPHLTNANRESVLARAAHRSKREIEELIAELAPRPDAPTLVRAVPQRTIEQSPLAPRAVATELGPDGAAGRQLSHGTQATESVAGGDAPEASDCGGARHGRRPSRPTLSERRSPRRERGAREG